MSVRKSTSSRLPSARGSCSAACPSARPSASRRSPTRRSRRCRLRDAEVEHLGQLFFLVLDQEDVVGLQIAVDDADLVRARDGARRCASGCAPYVRATDARPCAGAPPATRPPAAPSRCRASSPSTPWSRIWTTCGLRSAAAARASRMKRPSASGLLAICGSISLIATGDCSVRWWASQTDPMPPLPSRWTSLYLPASTWAPDASSIRVSTVTVARARGKRVLGGVGELQAGRIEHARRVAKPQSRSSGRCNGSGSHRCRRRRCRSIVGVAQAAGREEDLVHVADERAVGLVAADQEGTRARLDGWVVSTVQLRGAGDEDGQLIGGRVETADQVVQRLPGGGVRVRRSPSRLETSL